jgi:type III pantothenate kinase
MLSMDPVHRILVIDIGNTNTNCAVFEGEKRIASFIVESLRDLSVQSVSSQLSKQLASTPTLDYAVMASVVPSLTLVWKQALEQDMGLKLYIIDGNSSLGMKYPYPDPSYIGPDLVVNAYAAWKLYQRNCLVIDLGTATTIQLINSDGYYEAATIIPGMKTAADNLIHRAAMLDEIELKFPNQVMGQNTTDALLSGIVLGHCLMLEGFIARIKAEYQQKAPLFIILTGGLAALIAPGMNSVDLVNQELTLTGLRLAGEELRKKGL